MELEVHDDDEDHHGSKQGKDAGGHGDQIMTTNMKP